MAKRTTKIGPIKRKVLDENDPDFAFLTRKPDDDLRKSIDAQVNIYGSFLNWSY